MVDKSTFFATSPVPSDTFLWADEKPFTAFGQFGKGRFDMRVFEQANWWVDINGDAHSLEEMSSDYLANVIAHLYSNIEHFYLGSSLRFSIENILALAPTDGAPNDFEGYRKYVSSRVSPQTMDESEWLKSTPLVLRILSILDSRSDRAEEAQNRAI